MPGYICPLHGNTYLSDVCKHIGSGIDSKSLPDEIYIIIFNCGDLPGAPKQPLLFKYFHCPICVEHYNLPSKDMVLPDDEMDSLPDIFVPACSNCFTEALEYNGISVKERIRSLLTC